MWLKRWWPVVWIVIGAVINYYDNSLVDVTFKVLK